MGGALIAGIVEAGVSKPGDVTVAEIVDERRQELADTYGVATTKEPSDALGGADVVLIAVKPQILDKVLPPLSGKIDKSQTVVSIAAGVSTTTLEKMLGDGVRLVRAMPNIPAAVRQGATAICPGTNAVDHDMDLAEKLLGAVGRVVRIDETQMDAVTGLSGSGPGYAFSIIDALADGGVKAGLPKPLALTLAAQTLLGAAEMFLSGDKHPAELKDMITSPGGTTAAGLAMMDAKGIRDALISGVEASANRSKELGQ
jgi:pyrroline-5-carboxylate reductase